MSLHKHLYYLITLHGTNPVSASAFSIIKIASKSSIIAVQGLAFLTQARQWI